ncbi:MAG: LysE family translocator [Thermomicrobiales bacterium]
MSTEQTVTFLSFAVAAAITPGPSNIILASTGANAGVRRGLPCLFGVTLGMGVMLATVAFGVGSFILGRPQVLAALHWFSIAFLFWLAWKIATARRVTEFGTQEIMGFWQGAALQWVNPKSWLVSASAAGAFLSAGAGALGQSLALGALFVLAALPSCFTWLVFGASAQRLLRTDRSLRAFNLIMAALLAGSALLYVL